MFYNFFPIYQKNKERIEKKAHESYQGLSEEEKSKKGRCARERFRNLSEEGKNKKLQYVCE